MSWMFSIVKKNNKFKYSERSVSTIHPKAKYSLINSRIYLAAGGSNNMCISNINNSKKENDNDSFIVLGIGIVNKNNRFSFMGQNEWYNILKDEDADLNSLNGHFVTILINNNKIIIRNDQLGLRNLYYLETDNFIGISTRLNWLTKVVDNSEINLKSYSSFWNLMYCLSYKTFVKGVNKLGPGGRIIINENKKINATFRHWHPDLAANISGYDTINMLKDLTLFPIDNNKKINLALSGGIDSRTLLSFLLSKDKSKWKTTTWGKEELPDAIIAKELANHYNFQHETIYKTFPNANECVKNLYEYISETYATLPAYTMKELGYYKSIDSESIFIDGGSGALLRRVIGNKMLIKGRISISNKNSKNIYSIMKKHKADIFNDDTKKFMHTFTLKTIDKMLSDMPAINEFGPDNWIDLLNTRYFKPLNGTIAQSRIDKYLMNFMPFAQPSLLKKVFNLDERKRRSEVLNKKILMENKYLTKCPIVKYDTIIPFTLNLYSAYIKAMINRKFTSYPAPNLDIELLDRISDFVQDRVNSKAVIDYPYYDIKKIRFMINEYYNGNKMYARQLNWWLSYDIWREIISEKSVL